MILIRITVALAAAAALSTGAAAQGDPATRAGTFTVGANNVVIGKPLAAGPRKTAAQANADKVVAILRRDEALGHPIGYSITVRPSVGARIESDPVNMPFHSAVFGKLTYLAKEDNGQITASGESFTFHVGINVMGDGDEIQDDSVMIDHGLRMLPLSPDLASYRVTGQFRGRPVYNGQCTYVTHRSVPPLVPVTRERYLKVKILEARAELARHEGQRTEMSSGPPSNDQLKDFLKGRAQRKADNEKMIETLRKSGGVDSASIRQMREGFDQSEAQVEAGLRSTSADGTDARMKQIIDSARTGETNTVARLQARLDAMSPADRAAPAMVVSQGRGFFELVDGDQPDAIALVQPNPSFFDATLAPEIPQLIWVCIPGLQGAEDKIYERDAVRIRDGLDWAALEALLKP